MVEWGFKREFALQKFRSADVAYGSKAERLEPSNSCPLFTRQRRKSGRSFMSASCHLRHWCRSETRDPPLLHSPDGQSERGRKFVQTVVRLQLCS